MKITRMSDSINLPDRKNIRLEGFDYSKSGLYFITICTNNREYLFGRIENDHMILNDAGRMIEKWFRELEHKYPDKKIHEFVVMPNHFHGILENLGIYGFDDGETNDQIESTDAHVGAPLRGRPNVHITENHTTYTNDLNTNNDGRGRTDNQIIQNNESPQYGPNNRVFGAILGRAMDWFKTMTTNEYIRGVKNNGWQRFDDKLWQRNYHDHIIRDKQEYYRISEYIRNNPARWEEDRFR